MFNGMRELYSAPAHPWMIATANFEGCIFSDLLAGFGDLFLTRENNACHHQRLSAGAAFGEVTLDEQVIDTLLFRFGSFSHGPESR